MRTEAENLDKAFPHVFDFTVSQATHSLQQRMNARHYSTTNPDCKMAQLEGRFLEKRHPVSGRGMKRAHALPYPFSDGRSSHPGQREKPKNAFQRRQPHPDRWTIMKHHPCKTTDSRSCHGAEKYTIAFRPATPHC